MEEVKGNVCLDQKDTSKNTISIKDTIRSAMQAGSKINLFMYPKDNRSREDELASKNLELSEEVRSLRMQLNAYKLMYSASKRMQLIAA